MILLLTFLVVMSAFYMQYYQGLQPCPLCIGQRLCALLLALSCLFGLRATTLKQVHRVAFFQAFFSGVGLFLALRQVWLQSTPADNVSACLPGMDVLLHYFPWKDVLYAMFWGSSSCAKVHAGFLGLSIPAWAALYFVFSILLCCSVFFKNPSKPSL